uniref:Uncharacterized protein n=1 Tax=viral metagenome TaxID=1070528 RepID=A0A6C0C285_9ZZZZ
MHYTAACSNEDAAETMPGRARSRSPRRELRQDECLQQCWRLGKKRAYSNSSCIELLRVHEHIPASFKLYRDDEWLRGCPSKFTPLTKEAIATPFPAVKMNVGVHCSDLAHRIELLDEWVFAEVKRQQHNLGIPFTGGLDINTRSSLFTRENRPPTLDAKIYMDSCAKPTQIAINECPQNNVRDALLHLADCFPSWHDWQCIPFRAEVQPTHVWVAHHTGKIGIDYKLVSLYLLHDTPDAHS